MLHRLSSILLLLTPALAGAQALCPGDPGFFLDWTPVEGDVVDIEADDISYAERGQAVLRGSVRLADGEQGMAAERVTIVQATQEVHAEGSVRYANDAVSISAREAHINLEHDRGELSEIDYRLTETMGRGDAESVELQGDDAAILNRLSYTTCAGSDPDWQIRARRMDLDFEKGVGYGYGLGLRFKGVPLLYLPYARVPIDDRRTSGLLYPSIGSSNDDGLDISQPIYWNIAPNADATFRLRHISERGGMIGSEWRYLFTRHHGMLDVEYMPDDNREQRHRAFATWEHYGRVGEDWRLTADINHVSDADYFEDFGDSLLAASRSFLRSRAAMTRVGHWWRGGVAADLYQTLDDDIGPAQEPYNRLPRFWATGSLPVGPLYFDFDGELVDFDRDVGTNGVRLDLYPRLSYPFIRPAGYIEPSLGVRHTSYKLEGSGQDDPSRTLPILSVEGGLTFERDLDGGGYQTLEPRLHYLYVPFEDQSDFPEFDTRELTFGVAQIFRDNRFTGPDRQADANQLGLLVTSRWNNAEGREWLNATFGTIAYLRDQRVQLSGLPAATEDLSPLLAELNYRPSEPWHLRLGFQYDPEADQTEQAHVALGYQIPGGLLVNLAYRHRRGLVRQSDIAFLWPINPSWKLIGRWNYSFRDNTDLETLLGFEYESCCWALRTFARRHINTQEGGKRNGIYLELELKGLGSLGRRTDRVLENAILGYRSEDYRDRSPSITE